MDASARSRATEARRAASAASAASRLAPCVRSRQSSQMSLKMSLTASRMAPASGASLRFSSCTTPSNASRYRSRFA